MTHLWDLMNCFGLQMMFLFGTHLQTLYFTLGEAIWIEGHATVPQGINPLTPLITLWDEAENLTPLIIILAWKPTNVTNGPKIIQPFLKCKLQYLGY